MKTKARSIPLDAEDLEEIERTLAALIYLWPVFRGRAFFAKFPPGGMAHRRLLNKIRAMRVQGEFPAVCRHSMSEAVEGRAGLARTGKRPK